MLILENIIKEIKSVPEERLEEIYEFIHSLNQKPVDKKSNRDKVIAFGGAFKDMSEADYLDYLTHTEQARKNLFNRNIDL
jgi:hypothetical protein